IDSGSATDAARGGAKSRKSCRFFGRKHRMLKPAYRPRNFLPHGPRSIRMLELAVSGRQDCSLFCCIPGAVFPALPPVEESLMKPILRPLLFCFSLTLFPL